MDKTQNVVVKKPIRNYMINTEIIEWEVISQCNYDCSYCELPNYRYVRDKSILNNFIKKLKSYDSEIFIFGGEPFLNKNIKFIIDTMNKYKLKFVVQSNGSLLSLDKIIKEEIKNFKINISIHPDQVSIEDTLKSMIKLLIHSRKNNVDISAIHVMYIGDKSIEYYWKIKKFLKDSVPITIIPISGFYESNSCELTKEYNVIKEIHKDIEFEDIEIENMGIQRSVAWEMQCEGKLTNKGNPCMYSKYKLFDSMLNNYNCCYRKNTTLCEYDKCFYM